MSVDSIFGNNCHTILAPMAGYTDQGFRSICHSYGAGLTVTEMVSSKALVMDNSLSKTLLLREDDDTPCFAQIFGHEPSVMADSVQLDCFKPYQGVDINMGCPVHKIVSNGDGSALLQNPELAGNVISSVRNKWKGVLSVKFRLGVDNSNNVVDFARMCEDNGADMITVHFRTRKQMYAGKADYSTLESITSAVHIPVIANGDVETRQQYLSLTERGAYGVAVGRGALGRPYVFSEIADKSYSYDLLPTLQRHMAILSKYYPEHVVVNEMKKHVACYLKGKRNGKKTVVAVTSAETVRQVTDIVSEFVHKGEDND